jgi:hypothetical protein
MLLTGCAHWTTYNKQVPLADGASMIFVDAKQRAIISNPVGVSASGLARTDVTAGGVPGGGSVSDGSDGGRVQVTVAMPATTNAMTVRRYCAEPSPDALSALAATTGLNLAVSGKGELGYQQGLAEGAAFTGLRTQSIQILRDVMYRNCEALLNQGITEFGLETMQRRFQSTLVAVLAIEQLTGATKAQAVALGAQARSNDAETLSAAIKLVADAETAARSANAQLESATTADKAAQSSLNDYKKAHPDDTGSGDYLALKEKADKSAADLAAAKQAASARQIDLEQARAVRAAAGTAGGTGAVAASISPGAADSMKASSDKVAEAVTHIVDDTLSLGFGREVCTTLFGRLLDGTSAGAPRSQNRGDVTVNIGGAGPAADVAREKLPLDRQFALACIDYLKTDVQAGQINNLIAWEDARNRKTVTDTIKSTLDLVAQGKMTGDKAAEIIAAMTRPDTVSGTGQKPLPQPPMKPQLTR